MEPPPNKKSASLPAQPFGKQPLSTDNTASFAETAMRLGGKSEEEASRTGAMDKADDQVEALFASQYKTVNSPVHKAIWGKQIPYELFAPIQSNLVDSGQAARDQSIQVIKRHKEAGTIYDEQGKISKQVFADLASAGYWGMLIPSPWGGQGLPTTVFMSFLTEVATIDPTVAGLASVHGCIGAVDPIKSFGSEAQKQQFLPQLANGSRLSAFALTEPGAGSDLTALKTTAYLDGDSYVVNGEKLFITNAIPGRTIGLVCLIEGKPSVLIADLPAEETEQFQVVPYKLHALSHAFNNGLRFKNFRIPKENLLIPTVGDGLTIAYHGLNLGRLALCANSAGIMRVLLSNMLPWAHYRKTYGAYIETRELVKRRIARAAGLICGADALVAWGSSLLDSGYRGELECIIAKIFGSEALKEVALELFMKTHGGRSFLKGHLFGDNVHDFLAPCIYEGEGEMLGMAFFKALAKNHGVQFFEPVGLALQRNGLRTLNPLNPMHVWALRKELVPYSLWYLGRLVSAIDRSYPKDITSKLIPHVDFAAQQLQRLPLVLSKAMVKHQLKLADRQCRIAYMSQQVQDVITILVSCFWANQQNDETIIAAVDILCQDLKRKLTAAAPTDAYFRATGKLADMIMAGQFKLIEGITPEAILFPYST